MISVLLESIRPGELVFSALEKYHIKIEQHQLLVKYYSEYYQEEFKDLSFVILIEDTVLALVLCCKLHNKIIYPGEGIKINVFPDQKFSAAKIFKVIVDDIEQKSLQYSCSEIVIKDELIEGELSELSSQLFNSRYHAKITFDMKIDIKKFNENYFFKNVRKSYKSLINWGRKNLQIEVINKENCLKDKFLAFKLLHYQVSKRQTRSDESWDIQYEMLSKGYGELILAFYENKLVGGALLLDHQDTCIYFTGAYVRELFNFGLSHFIIYTGIVRSFWRNAAKVFYLGRFDTDIKDEKLYNIEFFKKGFCKNLTPILLWGKVNEL